MRALLHSRLHKGCALILALWVLVAVFADLLASHLPVLAVLDGDVAVLPMVTGQQRLAGQPIAEAVSRLDGQGFALWPVLRQETPVQQTTVSAALPARATLAMLIHASRGVLVITIAVICVSLVVGVSLGALAGYWGSVFDALLARGVELTSAVPVVVLLAVAQDWQSLGKLGSFLCVVALLRTIVVARLVRGEVLRVAGQDFVLGAQALGASALRIVWRHILPHALTSAAVSAALTGAWVIALESALSLVGLGGADSQRTWGGLLAQLPFASPAWLAVGVAAATVTFAAWTLAESLSETLSASGSRGYLRAKGP